MTPEAIYTYTDADGNPLYEVVRNPGKQIRQRRRGDNGRWIYNLEGVPRILYRLPEVLAAAKAGRAVWCPEGEKDADNLRELGFVATTGPMGASAWDDSYADSFRGCAAVLIPVDADEPGRELGQRKAAACHARGIPARVIDLYPERDDKSDVSDYIVEQGDRARAKLETIAKLTPPWGRDRARKLALTSVGDFLRDVEPYDATKDYLGPFLHGGYRMLVLGPTGHGKTTCVMEAVAAAARGSAFLGWVGAGVPVLYLNLELPGELFAQSLRDARLTGDVPNFTVGHLPLGLHLDVNKEHRRQLEEMIEPFKVVVLDPWAKAIRDELEYSTFRGLIAYLDGLRERHPDKCIIVNAHTHPPASSKERVGLANQRGFKTLQDQMDVILTFQRIGRNESRVLWEKNRSPKLGVTNGDEWTLRWARGRGFERVDDVAEGQGILDAA